MAATMLVDVLLVVPVVVPLVVVLAGCSGKASAPTPRSISLGSFARGAEPDPVDGTSGVDEGEDGVAGAPDGDSEPGSSFEPDPFPLGAGSLPGDYDRAPLRPVAPGEPVIVDSLVGQVNGRPIFADEFFEPLEDRLIAIARETTVRDFIPQAGQLIFQELRLRVETSLVLAEAESQIQPEQQVGLRAWLQQMEEGVVADRGQGSTEVARRQLLEEEGQTLEAHMEQIRDQALIGQLLKDQVASRIIVSWRDIERAYERRRAEFNPPATVTLARIVLLTGRQAETIEIVGERLDAGEDFLAVADSIGGSGAGIWQTFEAQDGDLASIEFANETFTAMLATVKEEGDTAGPVEIGTRTWWLHVAEVERPPQRSLYDQEVQRTLATQIRRERGSEEQQRYIRALLEKGIYDELEGMATRLLEIAVARYGPRQ